MVRTTGITYTYGDGQKMTFPDIGLPQGEHLLVIGPSGIGKTTLLYLLAGLLPPLEGDVTIAGSSLAKLSRKELDGYRGEYIGLIFQQYYFIKSLNVLDNLKLRQKNHKTAVGKQRRDKLTDRLGLSDHLHKKVTALSQGQQQRLSIALGLIHKPKVILADEPTSNLDDANCVAVINLLKEEAEICKSSLVIITHDQRVMAHFKNSVVL